LWGLAFWRMDTRQLATRRRARDSTMHLGSSRDPKGTGRWRSTSRTCSALCFRPGLALDRSRGFGAYERFTCGSRHPRCFPGGPSPIAWRACRTDRTRYTVSVLMDFTPEGILTRSRFARSAIKRMTIAFLMNRRWSYEEPRASHPASRRNRRYAGRDASSWRWILRPSRFARGAASSCLFPNSRSIWAKRGRSPVRHLAVSDESHPGHRKTHAGANGPSHQPTGKSDRLPAARAPRPEAYKLLQFAEFRAQPRSGTRQPQSRFELQRVLKETIGKARGIRRPLRILAA